MVLQWAVTPGKKWFYTWQKIVLHLAKNCFTMGSYTLQTIILHLANNGLTMVSYNWQTIVFQGPLKTGKQWAYNGLLHLANNCLTMGSYTWHKMVLQWAHTPCKQWAYNATQCKQWSGKFYLSHFPLDIFVLPFCIIPLPLSL